MNKRLTFSLLFVVQLLLLQGLVSATPDMQAVKVKDSPYFDVSVDFISLEDDDLIVGFHHNHQNPKEILAQVIGDYQLSSLTAEKGEIVELRVGDWSQKFRIVVGGYNGETVEIRPGVPTTSTTTSTTTTSTTTSLPTISTTTSTTETTISTTTTAAQDSTETTTSQTTTTQVTTTESSERTTTTLPTDGQRVIEIKNKDGQTIGQYELAETEHGYNLEFSHTESWLFGLFSEEKALVIGSVKELPEKTTVMIDETNDKDISTEMVAVSPSLDFQKATVKLKKKGNVEAVYRCDDFDPEDFSCKNWKRTNLEFEDKGNYIEFQVSEFSAYAGGDINVINVKSYPTVGGEWTVKFTTEGSADLVITPVDGTTWSDLSEDGDLKFLEIKCGDQVLDYQWRGDSVFISDYSCGVVSFETSKVLTSGSHFLEFRFGDDVERAQNWASDYSEWGYRQNISLTTSVENLTNYPVLIELDSSNVGPSFNWNNDRDAVRFAYYNETSDEESPVSYWIENWSVTDQKTSVWIKIPYLRKDANETVFMYYNKTGVTNESSGDDVFLLFDDFSGTLYDDTKWGTNFDSAVTVTDGYIRMDGDWNTGGHYFSSDDLFDFPVSVEALVRTGSYSDDSDLSIGWADQTTEWWDNTDADWILYDGVGSGSPNCKAIKINGAETSGQPITTNDWVRIKILHDGNEIKFFDSYNDSWTNASGSSRTDFHLHIVGDSDGGGYVYYDYILVRNHSSPEPTYQLHTEEEAPPTNVSLQSPAPGATVDNPVNFTYLPFSVDSGCKSAELYFNLTENITSYWSVDTTAEWNEGTAQNITSTEGKIILSGGGGQTIGGIHTGYISGNMDWHNNQWGGGYNGGEVDITCPGGDGSCWFYSNTVNHTSLDIGNGIAMSEDGSIRYIMYSEENVHTRMSAHSSNSDNFIGVCYSGGTWYSDDNSNCNEEFTPVDSDVLVANLTSGNPIPWFDDWEGEESETYSVKGNYTSKVFDAGKTVTWNSSVVTNTTPTDTSIVVSYSTNKSGDWVYYDDVANIPESRYLKFNFTLSTSNLTTTPEVHKVNISYIKTTQTWESRKLNQSLIENNTVNGIEYDFTNNLTLPAIIEWNIRLDGGRLVFDSDNRTVIVQEGISDTTPPVWSSNDTDPTPPASPGQTYWFNLSWSDADSDISTVLFESNFSGGMTNVTMSNEGSVYYNYSDLPSGIYVWRAYANDTSNNWNSSDQWVYEVSTANAPEVRTLTLDDNLLAPSGEIDLTPYGTKVVWCNATVYDADGGADISTVNATFYNSSTGISTDDNNFQYTNASCGLGSVAGNTRDAWCKFTLEYYADPGNWTCKMSAYDSSGYSGSNTSNTSVKPILGIYIDESKVDFGSLDLGATSSNAQEQSLTVRNAGNQKMDISLWESEGTAGQLECTEIGNIPSTNVHYSLTESFSYDSGDALQDSSTTMSGFDLEHRQNDGSDEAYDMLYWKIQIPATEVAGQCHGIATITAVNG